MDAVAHSIQNLLPTKDSVLSDNTLGAQTSAERGVVRQSKVTEVVGYFTYKLIAFVIK